MANTCLCETLNYHFNFLICFLFILRPELNSQTQMETLLLHLLHMLLFCPGLFTKGVLNHNAIIWLMSG